MWDLKFHLNGHMWTSGEHNLADKDKKNERKFEKLELVKVCKFYHISFFFFRKQFTSWKLVKRG